ncbi:MAG: transglycosylase SLT domain-containing protein [Anaerolineales bacterium]|nr:transglycosylase SLT domain-containing protein [Anaerolineales bacterium]
MKSNRPEPDNTSLNDSGRTFPPLHLTAGIPFLLAGVLLISFLRFWRLAGNPLLELVSTRAHPPLEATQQINELSSDLSGIFTPEVLFWAEDIQRWGEIYDLDPNLIAVVMQIESCGHPGVVSSAGALGLFQVMPFHFDADEDPLDPEINARRGLMYLARSVSLSEGRPDLALAGYNGGHLQIDRPSASWPDETRRYVNWGFGILEDIADGFDPSEALNAWLSAGGSSLCLRANRSLALSGD